MSSNPTALSSLQHLLLELSDEWRGVYQTLAEQLDREFKSWHSSRNRPESMSAPRWLSQQICNFLEYRAGQSLTLLEQLNQGYRAFSQRYQNASSEQERHQHQLAYAKELGQSRRGLRADRQALVRWFDASALRDRYQRRASEEERLIVFIVDRLGANLCHYLRHHTPDPTPRSALNAISQQTLIERLISRHLDHRITVATMTLLARLLEVTNGAMGAFIEPQVIHYCYRLGNDPNQPVWLQCHALQISLQLDTEASLQGLQQRFERQETGDQIFFRGRALTMMVPVQQHPLARRLYRQSCADSSEHVRQCLVQALPQLAADLRTTIVSSLIHDDPCDRVKARLLRTLPLLAGAEPQDPNQAWPLLQPSLSRQTPALVVKAALAAVTDIWLTGPEPEPDTSRALAQALAALHTGHQATAVRRAAAQTRERIWANRHPLARTASMFRPLTQAHWQQRARITLDQPVSNEELGRFFASLARDSYGYDIVRRRNRLTVTAGSRYQFRSWRFLHELRTSASDKRQNYNHTKGRVYHGTLQAPAWHLAELSQTTVPGEPLHFADDGDWRPYLPLPDQLLSALDQGWPTRPVELFTAEGITRIHPPSGLWPRLRARLALTLRFATLSRLRNWQSSHQQGPEAYLASLQQLGFRFELLGHQDDNGERHPTDPRVTRFFPGFASLAPLPVFWQEFKHYFYSVYENNLQHLLIFFTAAITLFFGRHAYLGQQMKKARASLPLVIGGWGTRGKSGTERLKAALFNALGLSVVSKTTGCEAMFLYSPAHGQLREMFLFRPYDKASIWEQVDLVRLAARFNSDVFLWECMGLTPRYVQILQEQWMRDDLATITNCYPDHEDIQGPSGIEIPQVMQKFVPKRSKLITTEHNMFPFLRSAAHAKRSEILKVEDWEAELLPADILARFPYEEHPANIALVVRMARELGLEADFALKEMADRVVPDLGVLKIYPRVEVEGRGITFINGMSANERHAALANWKRLQFDSYTLADTPQHWVATVINNRADRVPRSQVFARMLAQELSADHHFLIGTNLDGLQSYIDGAWQARLDEEGLGNLSADELLDTLARYARQLKVATTTSDASARTTAMLGGLGLNPEGHFASADALRTFCAEAELVTAQTEAVVQRWQADHQELQEYERQATALRDRTDTRESLRTTLDRWFARRFTVILDSHARGDEVLRTIIDHTPPGLDAHVMGMQNIKGTGLDFIYRWQAWDQHYHDGQKLLADEPEQALIGARGLAAVEDFGWLDFDYLARILDQAADRPSNQTQAIQAELTIVRSRLAQAREAMGQADDQAGASSRHWDRLLDAVESLLDAGAAVRRRKRANQIYRDLAGQRISHERAALELKDLNRSQKGGWLKARFRSAKR
ncbi:hypothetical protein [Marinobacter sp. SS21]|uniref:hypothetical protein n=1 Tax=Marinobacter sp. SS21 TaxID=2979460 RepID=UPI00232B8C1D|nr:hypothetical protein [Marinobacter sp. SS21]MDC0662934.1 hypothetical protein [Marinobacter sp. SS21]